MKTISRVQTEQHLIILTIAVNFLGSLICLWVGLRNQSNAIIFDTIYCLLLSAGYLGLYLLNKQKIHFVTLYFRFGFYKLQSIISIIQSLLIVIACILALINMVIQFIQNQYVTNYSEIILFQSR